MLIDAPAVGECIEYIDLPAARGRTISRSRYDAAKTRLQLGPRCEEYSRSSPGLSY